MSKWVSVKDRLPDAAFNVLVFDETGRVLIAWYFEYQWRGERLYHKITHWMPLPEPPKDTL